MKNVKRLKWSRENIFVLAVLGRALKGEELFDGATVADLVSEPFVFKTDKCPCQFCGAGTRDGARWKNRKKLWRVCQNCFSYAEFKDRERQVKEYQAVLSERRQAKARRGVN